MALFGHRLLQFAASGLDLDFEMLLVAHQGQLDLAPFVDFFPQAGVGLQQIRGLPIERIAQKAVGSP